MENGLTYFAGKAQPGSETRACELQNTGLGHRLGVTLYPGTFNVALMDAPHLIHPEIVFGPYHLWRCEVSTPGMIRRDEPGIKGWVIRVYGEKLPDHFVEIVSEANIRKELKLEKFPSFPVEIGLN